MVSHVQKGDLEKTVPRNVSVTTMAFVCHLLDSASVALDTQENGKRDLYNKAPQYSTGFFIPQNQDILNTKHLHN